MSKTTVCLIFLSYTDVQLINVRSFIIQKIIFNDNLLMVIVYLLLNVFLKAMIID